MPERIKYLLGIAAEILGAVAVALAIYFPAREVSKPEVNPVDSRWSSDWTSDTSKSKTTYSMPDSATR